LTTPPFFQAEEVEAIRRLDPGELSVLYLELGLPYMKEFVVERALPLFLDGILEYLKTKKGIPISRYDGEILERATERSLRALAREFRIWRSDGRPRRGLIRALLRRGEACFEQYGPESPVALLMPYFLEPLLRKLNAETPT
jgi:hypothetical protein